MGRKANRPNILIGTGQCPVPTVCIGQGGWVAETNALVIISRHVQPILSTEDRPFYLKETGVNMRKSLVLIVCLAVTMIAVYNNAGYAVQDSDEQISTVALTISPTCNLGIVDSDVSKTITQGSTADTAFSQGYIEFDPDKPTLIINSNKKWKLSVRSSDVTGPYSKKISDLQVKDLSAAHVKNGFDDYQSLSKNDQDIAMYDNGIKNETHPLQYKMLLDWEKDIPGTYEATVTYTLSTLGS